jgi:ribonucleoside-diphosphate reductase alpha chain
MQGKKPKSEIWNTEMFPVERSNPTPEDPAESLEPANRAAPVRDPQSPEDAATCDPGPRIRMDLTESLLDDLVGEGAKTEAADREARADREYPMPRFTKNGMTVLERRYLKKDDKGRVIETPDDMLRRVASDIASVEAQYGGEAAVRRTEEEFFEMMRRLEFLPNSPTLMNAGRELQQLSACFVLPVGDSMESIFDTVKNTALIHKSGGGTGFSFSSLRPKNDVVRSTKGVSSGPVSFMTVFDAATEAIKQGGTRRGANMGILRYDHPDIVEFIRCKEENSKLNNFNISVGVDHDFMVAAQNKESYDLKNPRTGETVGTLNAREVFDLIVEMGHKNGEPGIVFLDRVNADNPTPHLGEIESTNPCGEQPLLPYESCNLGSINLARMVQEGQIHWDQLRKRVHQAVRFLDNVIERNRYPLPEIERMTKGNRKIGLGVMGFADMLIQLGVSYNSEKALDTGGEVMRFVTTEARNASAELAKERGAFPNFEGSRYDSPGGVRLRNATCTTIAPTGTISIIAGCSSGIEPLFALAFVRKVLDKDELVEVHPLFEQTARDEGFYDENLVREIAEEGSVASVAEVPKRVRDLFVTAHETTPDWHVRMQGVFQKYSDNAVSKTVNFHREATRADVAKVYMLADELGCKGVTVYRDGSREEQVLNVGGPQRADADPQRSPRSRPKTTRGVTVKMETGCGQLYVTINEDQQGLCEVFSQMGKAGGCASSQSEAIARLVSLSLRSGVDTEAVLRQISGIRCPSPVLTKDGPVLSCPDAIAKAIRNRLEHLEREGTRGQHFVPWEDDEEYREQSANVVGMCPDCGFVLTHEEGCATCRICGYSRCG